MICAPCAAAWRTSCSALAILAWRSQLLLIWVAATVTRRGMAFSDGWGVARAYPIDSKVIEFDGFGYHRKLNPWNSTGLRLTPQATDPADRTPPDAHTPSATPPATVQAVRKRSPTARQRTPPDLPARIHPLAAADQAQRAGPGHPRQPAYPVARPPHPYLHAAVVRRWRWRRAYPGYAPARG